MLVERRRTGWRTRSGFVQAPSGRAASLALRLCAWLAVVFGVAGAPGVAAAATALGASKLEARVLDADGAAEVVVAFDQRPSYTARIENSGRRLVIDVPNARLAGAPSAVTSRKGLVGGVMAQSFKTDAGPMLRVLVTLMDAGEHSVRVEGNTLVVRVSPAKPAATPAPEKATAALAAASESAGAPTGASVMDVRYEAREAADEVVIDLTAIPAFRALPAEGNVSRLLLMGATLPEALQQTRDVSAMHGRVTAVSTYASTSGAPGVVLEAERAAGLTSRVEKRGDSLVWLFAEVDAESPRKTGVAADGGVARRARTLHVEQATSVRPEVTTKVSELNGAKATTVDAGRARAWTGTGVTPVSGRRIDLDLKDADINNVLRLLADVGEVNVVAGDDVTGTVTIRMRNVPWEEALSVILQSKGLGMVRVGNIIRVAPASVLEQEREAELRRNAQKLKLEPVETRLVPISYADAAEIAQRASDLLSSRGSITVDARTNVLIVRDVPGALNQIEELIRALDTQTPQVLVESRIVEATSRYLRDVGIQWGGDVAFTSATGNPTGVSFPSNVTAAGGNYDDTTPTGGLSPFTKDIANPNFAVNLPATTGTGVGGALGLTFGALNNTVNIAVRLSAAEASGMLRILSSPRILTLDNEEARINQGTLIPYSVVSAAGVQTIFREAKLQLLVRPHVTADGSVAMNVKVNRDEPDWNQTSSRGDPTIHKREAETRLLVMDGHTAVIGGIYTRNTGNNLDQIPFFGDIPILGVLFQRRKSSDVRTELVIFLTPRIVNRAQSLGH